jgi:hypothetical protein
MTADQVGKENVPQYKGKCHTVTYYEGPEEE